MNVDGNRAERPGSEHRTRDNRPRMVEVDSSNTVRSRPLTDLEVCELADRILARIHCPHRTVRESVRQGRLAARVCDDCGDHLPVHWAAPDAHSVPLRAEQATSGPRVIPDPARSGDAILAGLAYPPQVARGIADALTRARINQEDQ